MIHNQRRPVRLLVFNFDQEAVREVSVTPDFEWGGQGCLGCDVASGALHRIPSPSTTSDGQPRAAEVPPSNLCLSQEREKFEETQLAAASVNDQNPLIVSQVAISAPHRASEDQPTNPLATDPSQSILNTSQASAVPPAHTAPDPLIVAALRGESPKPAVSVMEKVSAPTRPAAPKAATNIAPPQTNLQPIPGFEGPAEISGNDDLSFLQ